MWRWTSSRTIVVTTAVVLFAACCLLPIAYLLSVPLRGEPLPGNILSLDVRQQALLWNTTVLGVGTALLATAIGAPLGLALARVPLRGKAILRVALAVPILLPPYIVALAWTYFGGSSGLVASITGLDLLSGWTYSLPAAILLLSLVFYPLSMLATEVSLRRIDGRLKRLPCSSLLQASSFDELRFRSLRRAFSPRRSSSSFFRCPSLACQGFCGFACTPRRSLQHLRRCTTSRVRLSSLFR
jgi:ABC-type Fe3+ transport system permease subunit